MISRSIFLLGFMASGKSSMGKKLARKLKLEFVDLDVLIEQKAAQSVTEIFESRGEGYFRELESEHLKEIGIGEAKVIALGGGTACNEANIKFIKESGISIYLNLSAEMLIGRLRQNKEKRPLVNKLSDEELRSFVENKLKERIPFYEQADLSINVQNHNMEVLLERIKEL